jgi:Flp pilus assembly protein TadG
MRRVFTIALVLVLLGVCTIDGLSLFYAYRSAEDVAKSAAQQAIIEYVVTNGNEKSAETAAQRYASSKDTQLLGLKVERGNPRVMTVRTRSVSETRLFKYIPFVKNYLAREYTASVTF